MRRRSRSHGTVCRTTGGSMADNATVTGSPVPDAPAERVEASKARDGKIRKPSVEDRDYNDTEYSDLVKLYEGTLGKISEGEIVRGRVVAIGDTEVSVDIGFKSEGVVPLAEFTSPDDLKVGEEIEA